MTTTSLGDARDHLSEYVAGVERTHDRVTITRYGKPAAVLVSAEELAALDETLDIVSTPGALDDIRRAGAEVSRGEYVTAEQMSHILSERRAAEHRPA